MKRVLVVGKMFSGLKKFLDDRGFEYVVLRDSNEPKIHSKTEMVMADFSSREDVEKATTSAGEIDAVMTIYENSIIATSWAANSLGLPGMPIEAAKRCTDKYLMRQAFASAPESISPDYAEVHSEQDLHDFANSHDFPVILKPANLAKSLLVTKNHNLEELLENYRKSMGQIHEIYKKYSPHHKPKLIIEEFLQGDIFSVDAFVDSEGTPHVLQEIVDYQTGYDIGFEDNFHYSRILPSKLSSEEQMRLRHVAKLGCEALGMKSSPAHIEIIMTKKGPKIVEIGARNGGYRERMHGLANGLDIPALALDVALGQKPNITPTKDEPCAVLELFPKKPGKFKALANQKQLENLPSLNYLSIKAKPGHFIGKAADGYKMAAVIILHNSDAAQFQKDLDFVNKHVYVETNN